MFNIISYSSFEELRNSEYAPYLDVQQGKDLSEAVAATFDALQQWKNHIQFVVKVTKKSEVPEEMVKLCERIFLNKADSKNIKPSSEECESTDGPPLVQSKEKFDSGSKGLERVTALMANSYDLFIEISASEEEIEHISQDFFAYKNELSDELMSRLSWIPKMKKETGKVRITYWHCRKEI
jgi:hypothetical protein